MEEAKVIIDEIRLTLQGKVVRVYLDPDYEYLFLDNDDEDGVAFIDGEVKILFAPDNSIATVFITDPGDETFLIIPGNLIHSIISIPESEGDGINISADYEDTNRDHYSNQKNCNPPGLVN